MAVRKRVANRGVFLNVPFDDKYEPLFVALIAALTSIGREPRCVLELPGSERRLDRITRLLAECAVSFHDLSRVQTSREGRFHVPRFNMPFELGLAVSLGMSRAHGYFLLEEKRHRLQHSLSDMNGFDPLIHGGTQRGIHRAVLSCLGTPHERATLADLLAVNQALSRLVGGLKRNEGLEVYDRHSFQIILSSATLYAKERGLIEA